MWLPTAEAHLMTAVASLPPPSPLRLAKIFYLIHRKDVMSAQKSEVSLLVSGVGTVLRFEKGMGGQWSNDYGKQRMMMPPPLMLLPSLQNKSRARWPHRARSETCRYNGRRPEQPAQWSSEIPFGRTHRARQRLVGQRGDVPMVRFGSFLPGRVGGVTASFLWCCVCWTGVRLR